MSDTILTESQQREIQHFVNTRLCDFIDEALCAPFLITDEMNDNDEYDVINAKKLAAIEYIKSIL